MLGNTNSLKREYFYYLLKQYMEKACTNVLNKSGWEQSGVYHLDCVPVWCVDKVYIVAAAAVFSAAEPLTSPKKSHAPLIELNSNDVDNLTTALVT